MKFELLPLLDTMLHLYAKPRRLERFQEYLRLLISADGQDIDLPIVTYNPMGKRHVMERLEKLKSMGAEETMNSVIGKINEGLEESDLTVRVAFVLADDLKGGWTNRYSTDYQNKFNLTAMIKRRFCTPIFWTSEETDESPIERRTARQIWRTVYQSSHSQPRTLEEHVAQESFVNKRAPGPEVAVALPSYINCFRDMKETIDYSYIFSFLYGDDAAREFGYTPLGFPSLFGGFAAAHLLSEQ